MKKLLKALWRKIGLGIRWCSKKGIPFSETILLRFWPEHLFHYSVYWFRKNKLTKANELISDLIPVNDQQVSWKERIISSTNIAKGDINWSLPEASENLRFNRQVVMALHNSAPYDFAGYWHRTQNILHCLREQNISVICATRPGYPWDLRKHRELKKVNSDFIDNVEFFRLTDDEAPYKQGSDFRYIHGYAKQLTSLAREQNASAVHGHSNYLNGLAAVEAARLAKISSVYEARGFWHLTRLSKDPEYEHTEAFAYDENMEKLALNSADKVVTLSQAMKKLIKSWGVEGSKVHVIPNAVDTERFSPLVVDKQLREQWPVDGFVIGFIGSITPYEGLLDLVAAVKLLRNAGIKVSLVVAGAGPFEDDLKQAIKGLGYIYYAGRIPHTDVNKWYGSFDCCAYPRKNDVVCRYVPPMKVLEAMAMEKPVIVSDLPPLTEMVIHQETGLVCQPDNPASLAECLKQLVNDKQLSATLAKNSRLWVEKNRTWKQNGERYMEMYSSI